MAMTASIALSSATCYTGGTINVLLTVSNSGASAVKVTNITPIVEPHSDTKDSVAVSVGVPALGPGITVSVPASGSLVFPWSVIPFSPVSSNQGTQILDLGALCTSDDGSLFAASTTTLTVTSPV